MWCTHEYLIAKHHLHLSLLYILVASTVYVAQIMNVVQLLTESWESCECPKKKQRLLTILLTFT